MCFRPVPVMHTHAESSRLFCSSLLISILSTSTWYFFVRMIHAAGRSSVTTLTSRLFVTVNLGCHVTAIHTLHEVTTIPVSKPWRCSSRTDQSSSFVGLFDIFFLGTWDVYISGSRAPIVVVTSSPSRHRSSRGY